MTIDKKKLFIANVITNLAYGTSNVEALTPFSHHDSIDWNTLKALLVYHELVTFAYLLFRDTCISLPFDFSQFLQDEYYRTIAHCEYLWVECMTIVSAFERVQMPLVPLKGISLLHDVYAKYPIRTMIDIDLLCQETDLDSAVRVMNDLGYTKELYGLKEGYWRKKQCHFAFYKNSNYNDVCIELHWGLDFRRHNRNLLPNLWKRIRKINIGDRRLTVLSPEDTLLSLALHNRRFGNALSLKYVCDVILLLKKYTHFNWDYVIKESHAGKMKATVYFLLSQVKNMKIIEIPSTVYDNLLVPSYKKKLIDRFIENNTFCCDMQKRCKELYLKSHFLLYDSLWEPIRYIINLPEEQFAKFYNFTPYDTKTTLLYHCRLLYVLFRMVIFLSNNIKFKADSFKTFFLPYTLSDHTNNEILFYKTTGFSMWPFLKGNEKVLCKKVAVQKLRIGDIVLYKEHNRVVCHRLKKKVRQDGRFNLYVCGDNSFPLVGKFIAEEMFVGKVIAVIKNGKLINYTGIGRYYLNRLIIKISPLHSLAIRVIQGITYKCKSIRLKKST